MPYHLIDATAAKQEKTVRKQFSDHGAKIKGFRKLRNKGQGNTNQLWRNEVSQSFSVKLLKGAPSFGNIIFQEVEVPGHNEMVRPVEAESEGKEYSLKNPEKIFKPVTVIEVGSLVIKSARITHSRTALSKITEQDQNLRYTPVLHLFDKGHLAGPVEVDKPPVQFVPQLLCGFIRGEVMETLNIEIPNRRADTLFFQITFQGREADIGPGGIGERRKNQLG
jgi:hypothetical protein